MVAIMKILDGYKLAASLHAGQVDKAGRPYIEHLSRVFLRVCDRGGDRAQQLAALFHDSIEDGKASTEQLLELGVPEEVVELVMVLTKQKGQSYASYIESVRCSGKAVLVKRCDLEDNSDPERLALLGAETASRLEKKYATAIAILER